MEEELNELVVGNSSSFYARHTRKLPKLSDSSGGGG